MRIAERHASAWTLVNVLAFQAVWWLQILLGPERPALALAGLGAWALLHLSLSPCRGRDAVLLVLLAGLGPWLDVLIERQGWLDYHGLRPFDGGATYWILGLWGGFALTLNHSLQPIVRRPWLAVGFGGLGGALAYLAGARFGAGTLPDDTVIALIGIGAVWAAVMGVLSLCLTPSTPTGDAP